VCGIMVPPVPISLYWRKGVHHAQSDHLIRLDFPSDKEDPAMAKRVTAAKMQRAAKRNVGFRRFRGMRVNIIVGVEVW
jgi:hypothetical protein